MENCKDSIYSEKKRIPIGEDTEGHFVERRGQMERKDGPGLHTEVGIPKGEDTMN